MICWKSAIEYCDRNARVCRTFRRQNRFLRCVAKQYGLFQRTRHWQWPNRPKKRELCKILSGLMGSRSGHEKQSATRYFQARIQRYTRLFGKLRELVSPSGIYERIVMQNKL